MLRLHRKTEKKNPWFSHTTTYVYHIIYSVSEADNLFCRTEQSTIVFIHKKN